MANSRPLSASPDAVRKRLDRFLKRGGVLVREACGGAVGVRWARAVRAGASSDFDARLCETRRADGRLRPVEGSQSAFAAPPPATDDGVD